MRCGTVEKSNRRRQTSLLAAALLAFGVTAEAVAQDAAAPSPPAMAAVPQNAATTASLADSPASVLTRAAAQAESLKGELPNFTCKVEGHSQAIHKGRMEQDVPFEGVIRAVRSANGRMVETNQFTTVNGQPYKEGKRRPYFVHGGFAAALNYVSRAQQTCSAYTLTEPHRVEFAARTPVPEGCRQWEGLKGWFRFDDDGNVTHIERTLPPTEGLDMFVSFAAVDLAPVELKDKVYWLASHIVSDNVEGDDTMRFEATYTDCRLFTTEIRILPGSTPVNDAGERMNQPAPKP